MRLLIKNFIVHSIIVLVINLQSSQAQQWEWSKTLGTAGQCRAYSLTSDHEGNNIIAGSFFGTVLFNEIKFTSYGSYDMFVAKYSPDGDLIWAKQVGGVKDEEAYGVTCDKNGNVFITGYFSGLINLTDVAALDNPVGQHDKNCIVIKYNKDGSLQWAMRSSGTGDKYGKAISTDKDGNVFFTGFFTNEMIIDFELCATNVGHEEIEIHSVLKSESASNIFTAKVANNSNFLWIQQSNGEGINEPTAIETDYQGNCYITGSFSGRCNFTGSKIKSRGGKDIFVTKYNPAGKVIWSKSFGGAYKNDQSSGIAKDGNGYIYLTGVFSGLARFGKSKLECNGNNNIFITKIDTTGNTLWVKQAGGTGNEYSSGIKLDSKDNIYVTGGFNTNFDFIDSKISNSSGWDIFVLNFDTQGKALKGYQVGGKGQDKGIGISINSKSRCFVLGMTVHEEKLDSIDINNNDRYDIFIAKIKEYNMANLK